ncbi:hypothetical protein PAXRUDRAFT_19884 [Paxillus rubicundulus Ve08.2h10]|uniref:Uncharacterized protein n=1 Tax=Paxillus rubicundulus Ve08.2h10 TaxID=930991 RepID=A0A0D0BSN4_9AGAM|nr:hypothetical protein PAXRUDRAFT_19884 [Paxillus rubicundulus Ve08.2h10]
MSSNRCGFAQDTEQDMTWKDRWHTLDSDAHAVSASKIKEVILTAVDSKEHLSPFRIPSPSFQLVIFEYMVKYLKNPLDIAEEKSFLAQPHQGITKKRQSQTKLKKIEMTRKGKGKGLMQDADSDDEEYQEQEVSNESDGGNMTHRPMCHIPCRAS